MRVKGKCYVAPFDDNIFIFEYGEFLRKKLGMKYSPDKSFYGWFMKRMSGWGTKGFLKDSFKIHGAENLKEEHSQLFLFNHELRHDPFAVECAITSVSGNNTPIPAPAYPEYVLNRSFSRLLQYFYSYPIYSKNDGNIPIKGKKLSNEELLRKKEFSLKYSEYCLFHYGRLLVFPTGELSNDGKQIKGISDGKPVFGKIGSAEILWRFYHHLHEKGYFEKEKRIQVIPGYLSYYPLDFLRNPIDFFKNLNNGSKIRVRFGRSLDKLFQKDVLDEFYSLRNKIFKTDKEKECLKKDLQKKFMRKVMDEIGNLVTINMGHIGSRMIYHFARQGKKEISRGFFERKLNQLVNYLKESPFYLSEHFENYGRMYKRYNLFLENARKEGFIRENIFDLELNVSKILFEPKYSEVRQRNSVLYNFNKLEHLENYKEIERNILNN